MIKFVALTFLLSIVVVSSAYCQNSGDSVAQANLRIGANLSLTGQLSIVGVSAQRGIELALDKAKELYPSLNIKVDIEDNHSDSKSSATAVRNLINKDPQIIFSRSTHLTKAIAPIVAEAEKVLFYGSTVRDIAESNPLFFRDYMDAEDNGHQLALLIKKIRKERVVYLGEQSDACDLYRKAFLSEYGKDFLRTETFNPGDKDFRPLLIKLRGTTPDALVLCTWRDTALVLRQLKEIRSIGLQTFHMVAPFLPENDTADARILAEQNGAISTWYDVSKDNFTKERIAFNDLYRARFNEDSRTESAYVYDDILMLAEIAWKIFERGESIAPSAIARELLAVRYNGVAGLLSFNDKGVSQRGLSIIKVKNGEWENLK